MPAKYNVVLIGIDTLRADHLSCYGYPRLTPNIAALAGEGVLFSRCFSQAPITAPSFMSIMTSRYPSYHGVVDNCRMAGTKWVRMYVLDKVIPTLAEVLKSNGYKTAAFTEGGNVYGAMGFERGFDYCSPTSRSGLSTSSPERGGHGIVHSMPLEIGNGLADKIFEWLKEERRHNFFLFFHTYIVHSPWSKSNPYKDFFKPLPQYLSPPPADADPYSYFYEKFLKDGAAGIVSYKAIYDGAVKFVDDFIGKLIAFLDSLEMSDSTIIVFTSDHGEVIAERGGWLGHYYLYNEVLRVPLIIKAPNLLKPSVVSQVVRSIDIMPTVLELLGIKAELLLQGVPLTAALDRELGLVAISEADELGYAVQDGTLKYINPRYRGSFSATDRLYDLEKDPGEKINIAPSSPQGVETMLEAFEAEMWRMSTFRPRRKVYFLY